MESPLKFSVFLSFNGLDGDTYIYRGERGSERALAGEVLKGIADGVLDGNPFSSPALAIRMLMANQNAEGNYHDGDWETPH